VIFPYMIGRDLVEDYAPGRWIIDFAQRDQFAARQYGPTFEHVKTHVMPEVIAKAEAEKIASGKESTRWTRMAQRWWQFRDYQPGTMAALASIPRYISCARVTKRPIFEFISSYLSKHGYPPTVREIGKAVGLHSSSTVHAHLGALFRLGPQHLLIGGGRLAAADLQPLLWPCNQKIIDVMSHRYVVDARQQLLHLAE